MSLNPHANDISAYRTRLLNTLLAHDVMIVMNRLGRNVQGDVLEKRFYLLRNWNGYIQSEVFDVLNHRLSGLEIGE